MKRNIKIIPGILEKDPEEIKKKIRLVEPYVSRVQIDVADGRFVPNLTVLDFEWMEKFETKLEIEFHLMCFKPSDYFRPGQIGLKKRVVAHLEALADPAEFIQKAKKLGYRAGLALNPLTPISTLTAFLPGLDLVQLMAIDPGFQGRQFRPEVLAKIRKMRADHPDLNIQIDGGIEPGVAKQVIQAGANLLVSGSFLFGYGNIKEAIEKLATLK